VARRVLIAGHGMAGARLIAELLRAVDRDVEIVALGAEPHRAYNRILLSAVLAGDRQMDEIGLDDVADAAIHLGETVEAVDRANRRVETSAGRKIGYDTLVLATGSWPVVLPLPGVALPGVMTFRDIADVRGLIAAAATGGRAVVIGGGLLGLEAAEGLRRRGMQVTVLHVMPWLMERQLDEAGGALLKTVLERRGISIVLRAETEAILGGEHVRAVALKDGREFPADLVVMAVGITPRAEIARAAGLRCGRGVLVNDAMQTSDPAIYAIGECAEHRGRCYGLVEPIWQQVAACARHIAGDVAAAYSGTVEATSLKVSGVELYSVGVQRAGDGEEEIYLRDTDRGVHRKLVVRDGHLIGAVLLGDAADGRWYGELIGVGAPLGALRRDLVFGRRFAESGALAA